MNIKIKMPSSDSNPEKSIHYKHRMLTQSTFTGSIFWIRGTLLLLFLGYKVKYPINFGIKLVWVNYLSISSTNYNIMLCNFLRAC